MTYRDKYRSQTIAELPLDFEGRVLVLEDTGPGPERLVSLNVYTDSEDLFTFTPIRTREHLEQVRDFMAVLADTLEGLEL